jgi:Fe-S cluster assembly protein SufD
MQGNLNYYTARFDAGQEILNGLKGSPIDLLRQKGFEKFLAEGFPTPRDERWKYTNLKPLSSRELIDAEANQFDLSIETLDQYSPQSLDAEKLVFVNGRFSPTLSSAVSVPGLQIHTIADLLHGESGARKVLEAHLGTIAKFEEDSVVALNTAFINDGLFVEVEKGVEVKRPLHVLFFNTAEAPNSFVPNRLLVVAHEQSEVTVLESHIALGENAYYSTMVGEIRAGRGARVNHVKIGLENIQSFHTGKLAIYQEADSRVESLVFTTGGKLVRNEVDPVIDGRGATTVLNGLTVLDGTQHVDNHTVIDHAIEDCESHELYKGIYNDKSEGIFSGTIIVRPDAQRTNAIQNNQSLLLSGDASVKSKPQLKIWADDVKCTHGATIGQLDEDGMFYLRSRGISQEVARKMMVHAFACDVLTQVNSEGLRLYLEQLLVSKLQLIQE